MQARLFVLQGVCLVGMVQAQAAKSLYWFEFVYGPLSRASVTGACYVGTPCTGGEVENHNKQCRKRAWERRKGKSMERQMFLHHLWKIAGK